MTEPEEIDEDLFADLYAWILLHPLRSLTDITPRYDAEENNTNPDPVPTVLATEVSEPIDTGGPIQNEHAVDNTTTDTAEGHIPSTTDADYTATGHEGHDESSHGWGNGDMDINSHQMDSPSAGESHTIGIKEDG